MMARPNGAEDYAEHPLRKMADSRHEDHSQPRGEHSALGKPSRGRGTHRERNHGRGSFWSSSGASVNRDGHGAGDNRGAKTARCSIGS